MAHFAKIENDTVTEVIVANQDYINTLSGIWIQTSYNTHGGKHYSSETGLEDNLEPLRKNYAAIGYSYDLERDAFIPPKPYNSWILDESSCLWKAPINDPSDENNLYKWDEESLEWVFNRKINRPI